MDNSWFYQQMAASSAPSSSTTQSAGQVSQPKKSRRWIIPAIAGIAVLVFVPLIIIALASKSSPNSPAETPTEEEKGNPYGIVNVEDTGYAKDLQGYVTSLAEDADKELDPTIENYRYTTPPAKFSCAEAFEITEMDETLLKLHLQYGFVILIDGKGSAPFTDSGNTVLIYGGSATNSQVLTVPYDCSKESKTTTYATYNSSSIFNNLTSAQHYYAWIDEKDLATVE